MHTRHILFLSLLFMVTTHLISMQENSAITSCELSRYNNMSLHEASEKGDLEAIRVLLRRGVDVDMKNKDGYTPLLIATYFGYLEVVQLLLDNDANVHAKDREGFTSLHLATHDEHARIVELLLLYGAPVDVRTNENSVPLHCAAYNGHMQIVELLVQHGADVNTERHNMTPLCYAIKENHMDVAKFLLNSGSDVNVKMYGYTLLQQAFCLNQEDIVELLLQKGANVDAKDGNGCTVLDYLQDNFLIKVAQIILDSHGFTVRSAQDNATKQILIEHCKKEEKFSTQCDVQADKHNEQGGNCIVQ